MPISTQCPHCQHPYQLPDHLAGKPAKCKCGNQFKIPLPARAAVSATTKQPNLESLEPDLQLEPLPAPSAPAVMSQPLPRAAVGMQTVGNNWNQPTPAGATAGFGSQGLWRAGSLLVLQTGAALPAHVCIKSGEPAASQRTEKLVWAPAWVHVTLLLGRVVHYAVMSSHGREITLRIGLGKTAALKRNIAVYGGYGVVALGLLAFVGWGVHLGLYHLEGDPIPVWPLLLGGILLAIGALVAHFGGKLLSARSISSRFAVIRGVSSRVLASLPEWPGELPSGESR